MKRQSKGPQETTFLLVHGSWHGPWCWELLVPELVGRGHAAVTIQLPSCGHDVAALGDYPTDVAAVTERAATIDGDVLVVGHSYGGAVISDATFGDRVRHLVYLAAFMPDSDRSYVSYLPPGDLPPYVGMRDDGTMAVPEGQATPFFYGDCPDDVARWATERLTPQSQSVLTGVTRHAAWRVVPSTYIVAARDEAIPPDLQRVFAAQAGEAIEIESSHSPMLSKPGELADHLARIAEGVAGGRSSPAARLVQ